jgi:hypothetical protein
MWALCRRFVLFHGLRRICNLKICVLGVIKSSMILYGTHKNVSRSSSADNGHLVCKLICFQMRLVCEETKIQSLKVDAVFNFMKDFVQGQGYLKSTNFIEK